VGVDWCGVENVSSLGRFQCLDTGERCCVLSGVVIWGDLCLCGWIFG
jgi:hypothetical protein